MVLNRQVEFVALYHMTLGLPWVIDLAVHLFQTSLPLLCSLLLHTAMQWCWRQASVINLLSSC